MWKDVRRDIHLPLAPRRAQIAEIGNGVYCNCAISPKVILELVKKMYSKNSNPLAPIF